MNANECESIRLAIMARLDGESASVPAGQVQAHLAGCPDCRREAEAMRALSALLAAQARRGQTAQLWPRLGASLAATKVATAEPDSAGFFVLLGLTLLACQAALFLVAPPVHLPVNLVGVVAVACLLASRQANPFVIETELALSQKGSL